MSDPAARTPPAGTSPGRPRVALLVTCLVDLVRPSVGFAAVKLLEDAGCDVTVPLAQTCCGQPAYNAGDRRTAQRLARQAIAAFDAADYVVAPSGSCAGMLRCHYAGLFADDPSPDAAKAARLAERTFELTQFLVDVMGVTEVDASCVARAVYHDSCSGLRELGIKAQPRALLAKVRGLVLGDYAGGETCCGFGGTFCVKYPEISSRIVGERAREIAATDAEMVVGGDLGCLLNIAGKLGRDGAAIEVRHVAEILANAADGPAIGEGR